MKSSYFNDAPVFSQPQQIQHQQKDTARKRTRILVRDIGFPVNELLFPLTTFYPFGERQNAVVWDGIRTKREPIPGLSFYNNYTTTPRKDPGPVTISAKSLIIIHPLVQLHDTEPIKLYLPLPGSQVRFTLVLVKRRLLDPANLEVVFDTKDVKNPHFNNTTVYEELAKRPRFKSFFSQIFKRENKVSVYQQPNITDQQADANTGNKITYPTPVSQFAGGGLKFQQPVVYHVQTSQEPNKSQTQQLPGQVQTPPVPRLPVVQHPTTPLNASHPTSAQSPSKTSFQKGKVALCGNCGVYSDNLETCYRCGKSNMGPAISENRAKQPKANTKTRAACEAQSEVVDLSSDENEDSQEAIIPNNCTVESSHLLTSLLRPQENGRDLHPEKFLTPEDVIEKLSDVTNKSNGSEVFGLGTCSYVRVGTYTVYSAADFCIRTTIGEVGLYFELPAYRTGETKQIGIPKHQILTLYANADPYHFYVKIQTGPKFARWIRNALNMDEDQNGVCYFCPMHGDISRQEFVIMFSDIDETNIAVLRRLYKDIYKTYTAQEANIVKEEDEAQADVGTKGTLVKVEWRGHNCTSTETLTQKGIVADLPKSKAPNYATAETLLSLKGIFVESPKAILCNGSEPQGSQGSLIEFPKPPPVRMKVEPVDPGKKLFHYPFVPVESDSNFYIDSSITLTFGDIKCLGDGEFLNDQVIDFWMRNIVDQLSPEQKAKSYVFSSFFYRRLTAKPNVKRKSHNPFEYDTTLSMAVRRHCRVKKWTKKVDIFEKDFLFVPINENAHWFMAVICFPGLVPVIAGHPNNLKAPLQKKGRPAAPSRNSSEVDENDDNSNTRDEISDRFESGQDESSMDTSDCFTSTEESLPDSASPVKPGNPIIKRPCIIIFDSLVPEPHCKVFSTLRDYLQVEHDNRKKPEKRMFDRSTMVGYAPQVPFQTNSTDCGLFLLTYTEAFFRKPIANFRSGKTLRIRKWFSEDEPGSKRQQVYEFIMEYVRRYFPENLQLIPDRLVGDPSQGQPFT